jgi:hypothetical protein
MWLLPKLLACTGALPSPSLAVSCAPTDNALRWSCAVTGADGPVSVEAERVDGRGVAPRFEAVEDGLVAYLLAPGTAYEVRATDASGSAETTFTTGAPPAEVASRLTSTGTTSVRLLGASSPCGDDAYAVLYDPSTGDLVWYEDLDPAGELGLEDMVRFTGDGRVFGEPGTGVVGVDLLGNRIAGFTVRDDLRLHHDFAVRGDTLYLLYKDYDPATDSVDDLMLDSVLVTDLDGTELGVWHSWDTLPIPDDATGNWLHTNAIDVLPDGDLLLSYWGLSTVAEVDGDYLGGTMGSTGWTLAGGHHAATLGNDFVVDWSRVDGPDEFGVQHAFHRRADGQYLLLDNIHGRALRRSIDPTGRTGTVEASYPTAEAICDGQGTAMETSAGTVLAGCSQGAVREYGDDGAEQLWEARVACDDGEPQQIARWYPLEAP